jgi:hypothetical protein
MVQVTLVTIIITGNSGINQINGGAGIDTLTGGLGADTLHLPIWPIYHINKRSVSQILPSIVIKSTY